MFLLMWLMGNTVSSETTGSGTQLSQGGTFSMLLPVIVLFAIIYFMMIRPSKKRDKETKSMLAALKKGDRIVTIGGIRGTVVSVKDSTVVVKVDNDARIEFNKTAIAQVLSSGPSYEDTVEKSIEKPAEKQTEKESKTSKKTQTSKQSSKKTSKKKTQKDKIKATKASENLSANESDNKADKAKTDESSTLSN